MDQNTSGLKPKVSVNIAIYNRGNFLCQAIESAQKQSFTDWEMIIVDDGSTDNTSEIIKEYLSDPRIKTLKNEKNLGICATRNRALNESQGEYIAILDSDDEWADPNKLKQQVDWLDQYSDCVAIGTGIIVIDKAGQEIKRYLNPETNKQIRSQLLIKNPLTHSSVLYRRDTALAVNGYHQTLNGIEDYDLWFKLGQRGQLHNLPTYSVNYRQHSSNISLTDRLRLMRENLNLIKKYHQFYPNFFYAWLRRSVRLKLAEILAIFN